MLQHAIASQKCKYINQLRIPPSLRRKGDFEARTVSESSQRTLQFSLVRLDRFFLRIKCCSHGAQLPEHSLGDIPPCLLDPMRNAHLMFFFRFHVKLRGGTLPTRIRGRLV